MSRLMGPDGEYVEDDLTGVSIRIVVRDQGNRGGYIDYDVGLGSDMTLFDGTRVTSLDGVLRISSAILRDLIDYLIEQRFRDGVA